MATPGFTGFPSRGGHFGIRRLNVSFGLGPQGFSGEVAKGIPGSRGDVIAPSAAASVVDVDVSGTVDAPTVTLSPTEMRTGEDPCGDSSKPSSASQESAHSASSSSRTPTAKSSSATPKTRKK